MSLCATGSTVPAHSAGSSSVYTLSALSSAAGNAGSAPRKMSCSRRKMLASYVVKTSFTPDANALRYKLPLFPLRGPSLAAPTADNALAVCSRPTNLSSSRNAYPICTKRSRLARSGGSNKSRSGFTANRAGWVPVAGTKMITSPETPRSARSTSGTIESRAGPGG